MATANELEHAPGEIVRWLLIELGLGSGPADEDDWPIYHSGEPDKPDDVVTVYDTAGVNAGRDMISGELYAFRGIQVRVRSKDQNDGWLKADAIRQSIAQEVVDKRVVVDGTPYIVNSFSKIGQVLILGKEPTASKRSLYTVNSLVSIRELPH